MKKLWKFIIVFIAIFATFGLAACGGSNNNTTTTQTVETQENNPQPIGQARSIKIVQIEGEATVTDANETIACFKGMNLYDGDELNVKENSKLVLRFDEDKYIYIDQLSEVRIKSEGKDSKKTNIFIEKGKVLAQIQNKLGEDEEFFLSSNNSVMAVRGTTFGVEVVEKAKEFVESFSVFKGRTELYVFDIVDGNIIKGKLSDIGVDSGKIVVNVPKEKVIPTEKFNEITKDWLKDVNNKFDDPTDANNKLDQVQIEVGKVEATDFDYIGEIENNLDVPTIDFTATGYFGAYDGTAHKVSITPAVTGAKVYYKAEGETEYSENNNYEYITPGSYRVYYKIVCEGYKDVEDFEVIYITKPNIIVESDYIRYNNTLDNSVLNISQLEATMFNKYNGVLALEVLSNLKFYMNGEEVTATTTVKYNKIIDDYIELVDGKNSLSVTFDFGTYNFTTNVDFIFSDTREDLGYSIASSSDYLENLSGNLYYFNTAAFTNGNAGEYSISGSDLLTAFGLDVDDLTMMLINYPNDIIYLSTGGSQPESGTIEDYDGTNSFSFTANVYNEVNFLIFPTAEAKGFNETIYMYLSDSKPGNYPSYEVGNTSYGYNANDNPSGVLMDFISSDYTVEYSIDGTTYNSSLYITEAGNHKVYYKVTNDSSVVTGYEYVNVEVGKGVIASDNLRFLSDTIYILSNDNHTISYSYRDSDGMTHSGTAESPDGRTITPLADTYKIYTDLLKNSKFYDSITKEEIDVKVTVSDKKDGSADFNYTVSANGYNTISGIVKFEYSEIGYYASGGKYSSLEVDVALPSDINVSKTDIPTVIPTSIVFDITGPATSSATYYSIDEGKTWTTEIPKITKTGTYTIYQIYCVVESTNNATELVPGTSNEGQSISLSASGNFVISIQNIVVTE